MKMIDQALGVELKGKVGVKISTGEPGGNNYLHPELISQLVKKAPSSDDCVCRTKDGAQRTLESH